MKCALFFILLFNISYAQSEVFLDQVQNNFSASNLNSVQTEFFVNYFQTFNEIFNTAAELNPGVTSLNDFESINYKDPLLEKNYEESPVSDKDKSAAEDRKEIKNLFEENLANITIMENGSDIFFNTKSDKFIYETIPYSEGFAYKIITENNNQISIYQKGESNSLSLNISGQNNTISINQSSY